MIFNLSVGGMLDAGARETSPSTEAGQEGKEARMWSCTEKDVARVLAGVVGHRLNVRDPREGPLRSAIMPAVGPGGGNGRRGRGRGGDGKRGEWGCEWGNGASGFS